MADIHPGEKALYVRGNDMINFPARDVVEQLMPVRFLPYTQGVSSTLLRKRLLSGQSTCNGVNGDPVPVQRQNGHVKTQENEQWVETVAVLCLYWTLLSSLYWRVRIYDTHLYVALASWASDACTKGENYPSSTSILLWSCFGNPIWVSHWWSGEGVDDPHHSLLTGLVPHWRVAAPNILLLLLCRWCSYLVSSDLI